MKTVQQIVVTAAEGDQRLDRWFKRRFPALTHGRLEKLLRTGQVRLDGKRAKASDRLEEGQTIRVPPLGEPAPSTEPRQPKPLDDRLARQLQRSVLYRDSDVLVINKPAGLAVQGGSGIETSLDAALDALQFDAAERPRLVHRLDRDTSGVLVLARSASSARHLAEAFRHKDAHKVYWAITVGVPKIAQGRIDAPLQKGGAAGRERVAVDDEGKRAITYYSVVERAGKNAAWLALMPITGRTHQLRAHCIALGTPILGDGKYGGAEAFLARKDLAKQLHLHARSIRLPHPKRGWIEVSAPLPDHMKKAWAFFGFSAEPDEDPFADVDV